jgi:mannose-6-phosphate isomerase-like protein (cupin superfamily)
MKNEWHVVKEDDRYVVLDNSSLSKLVPSITKLNPNKSTSGHKHAGQEEVYVFYRGTGIMQIDDTKFNVKQGDVIPVPDGAFHRVFNESEEILEFAAVFNGERHTETQPK